MAVMKEFLTDEEKALLQKQHRKERDKRICDRIKAVLSPSHCRDISE